MTCFLVVATDDGVNDDVVEDDDDGRDDDDDDDDEDDGLSLASSGWLWKEKYLSWCSCFSLLTFNHFKRLSGFESTSHSIVTLSPFFASYDVTGHVIIGWYLTTMVAEILRFSKILSVRAKQVTSAPWWVGFGWSVVYSMVAVLSYRVNSWRIGVLVREGGVVGSMTTRSNFWSSISTPSNINFTHGALVLETTLAVHLIPFISFSCRSNIPPC